MFQKYLSGKKYGAYLTKGLVFATRESNYNKLDSRYIFFYKSSITNISIFAFSQLPSLGPSPSSEECLFLKYQFSLYLGDLDNEILALLKNSTERILIGIAPLRYII